MFASFAALKLQGSATCLAWRLAGYRAAGQHPQWAPGARVCWWRAADFAEIGRQTWRWRSQGGFSGHLFLSSCAATAIIAEWQIVSEHACGGCGAATRLCAGHRAQWHRVQVPRADHCDACCHCEAHAVHVRISVLACNVNCGESGLVCLRCGKR